MDFSETSIFGQMTDVVQYESLPYRRTLRSNYLMEPLRPIVCLAFVAPFLFIYELGVIILGASATRNGVDVWLQTCLDRVGLGEAFLLPLITFTTLLFLHHRLEDRFTFSPGVLCGMLAESILLALILLFAAKAHHVMLVQTTPVYWNSAILPCMSEWSPDIQWNTLVAYCGAGLYEELAFRLLLLPTVVLICKQLGANHLLSILVGVAVTSLLFAASHYQIINPGGAEFELASFAIRLLASLFFCVVFLLRGFGIAVGTHFAFDVFTHV